MYSGFIKCALILTGTGKKECATAQATVPPFVKINGTSYRVDIPGTPAVCAICIDRSNDRHPTSECKRRCTAPECANKGPHARATCPLLRKTDMRTGKAKRKFSDMLRETEEIERQATERRQRNEDLRARAAEREDIIRTPRASRPATGTQSNPAQTPTGPTDNHQMTGGDQADRHAANRRRVRERSISDDELQGTVILSGQEDGDDSGHKFGLVYAGLGWIIFRSAKELPEHLIFELSYLGGTTKSYGLNFSRPANQMIAQYFNFIHLASSGYRAIAEADLENARVLSSALEGSGYFECVSDIHRKKGEHLFNVEALHNGDEEVAGQNINAEDFNAGLPVVAFKLTDQFHKDYSHVQQEAVSTLMRVKGWIIPNYPLPENEDKIEILRVVVRESCNSGMIDRLIEDIVHTVETLIDADQVDINALAGKNFTPQTHEQKHAKQGKKAGTKEHREHMKKHKNIYARPC